MDLTLDNLSDDLIVALGLVFFARMIVWILYANTVKKTFAKIREENRFIRPVQAWLLVIPLFNVYWNFVVARSLADSLTNEFYDRKIAEEEQPGRSVGMSYAWMSLLSHIPFPTLFVFTFGILSIIYFVQYWVKIHNFHSLLVEHDKYLAAMPKENADTDADTDAAADTAEAEAEENN